MASPVKTRPGGVCHLSFLSSCACLQGVNSDQPVCPRVANCTPCVMLCTMTTAANLLLEYSSKFLCLLAFHVLNGVRLYSIYYYAKVLLKNILLSERFFNIV